MRKSSCVDCMECPWSHFTQNDSQSSIFLKHRSDAGAEFLCAIKRAVLRSVDADGDWRSGLWLAGQ